MNDTAFGFLILGVGLLFVLGLVFAVSSRGSRAAGATPHPPKGVHLPPPSYLPSLMPLGGILIFAGLAFRPEDQLANWFLLVPGLRVFVASIVGWVRAADREWVETEQRPHDEAPGH